MSLWEIFISHKYQKPIENGRQKDGGDVVEDGRAKHNPMFLGEQLFPDLKSPSIRKRRRGVTKKITTKKWGLNWDEKLMCTLPNSEDEP